MSGYRVRVSYTLGVMLTLLDCGEQSARRVQGPEEVDLAGALGLSGSIIQVAPPTGDATTDRASIEQAIQQAQPGDIVRFATGTYVIGLEPPSPPIDVPVADVTLMGDAAGTIVRGGAVTDAFSQIGFHLRGGGARVAQLGFESFSVALQIGQDDPELGGYAVQGSRFERVAIGVMLDLRSDDPTVIARNVFVDVGVPFSLNGAVVQYMGNVDTHPNPTEVPFFGRPVNAGEMTAFAGFNCVGNRIENNHSDGGADGFILTAFDGPCSGNVVRNNVLTNERPFTDFDNGSLVTLLNLGGGMSENLVEANTLDVSVGSGLIALGVTDSRFVRNTIQHVQRNPALTGARAPGGTAIFLMADSHGNRVANNVFGDDAHCDVLLRAKTFENVVLEPGDRVRDLGTGNQVTGGGECGPERSAAAADEAVLRHALEQKVFRLSVERS